MNQHKRLPRAAASGIHFILAACAAILPSAYAADEQPVPKATADRLKQVLKAKTGLEASEVAHAPMKGLYEMVVGGKIYYVEPSGKWLFDGDLVDMATRTSVTAQRKSELAAAGAKALDWSALRFDDAIQWKQGTPTKGRELITFEDPNCGYCRKLFAELRKLENVTIYTFPVALLGPTSTEKNHNVWCSANRALSWEATMTGQPVAKAGACDTSALDRNMALASSLKVVGTPTIFTRGGVRFPGAVSVEALEVALSQKK